ncbi:MAG TPA: hypothetical protein VL991_00500 [Terracidiphilus sp.]|nr:hypothetical protein [Terracidiphilus sp.]
MKNIRSMQAVFGSCVSVAIAGAFALTILSVTAPAAAQNANPSNTAPSKDNGETKSYDVRESYDVGGRIVERSGSGAMYDTLVNMQSGPRILNSTLEVHALPGAKHTIFDNLFENSGGYGGDPNDMSTLRMSKGKLYDFNGMFRRDRQYFDYNLLGNPLVPSGLVSNGYTYPQIGYAPHLFNTVRRMTDVNLTLLPISKVSFRANYSQNINQGPTFSSIHIGAEALLQQFWRNSSDSWLGAVDWKPFHGTTLTVEEVLTHYKGDTSWQFGGQTGLALANGTAVSIGFDNVTAVGAVSASTGCSVAKGQAAIVNGAVTPAIANPCVNGYLQYTRSQPMRTIFPTEAFRFQSSTINNVQMTGRFMYTGANMNMPAYNEYFNGLESRVTANVYTPGVSKGAAPTAWCTVTKNAAGAITAYNDCLSTSTITGSGKAQRINVSADYGIVWQISRAFSVSEQFDFENFRQPAISTISEVDQYSSSMLTAPVFTGAASLTTPANYLGQRTESNRVTGEWEATDWLKLSLGYHYRARTLNFIQSVATDALATGRNYGYNDNENSGLFGVALRPNAQWRINGSVETGWANDVYVPVSPRQFQAYQIRTTYKPKNWAVLSGAYSDMERRDNAANVGYMAHNRSFATNASLAPSEYYSLDLSYGYLDVYSRAINCFVDTVAAAPADSTPMPIGLACGNAVNSATSTTAFYGTSRYDAPTQYGSAGIVLTPVKHFQSAIGYRVNAVDGTTELLNPLAPTGTLQSKYQSPYFDINWKLKPSWALKGDWNYYGYGEDGGIGPTDPRNFHGNMYTLGLHYEH